MRVDCHCDTVTYFKDFSTLEHLPGAHMDYRRLREYLDVSVFAIFLDQLVYGDRLVPAFQDILNRLRMDVNRQSEIDFLLWQEQVTSPQHTLILIGMEGAEPLGDHCEHLEEYVSQGLRLVGLTWNHPTRYGGSNQSGGGLTDQGRQLVARCNELGVVLDAAHCSEETLDDLLACSEQPILDSHTVCAAVCNDFPRSISDRQLIALADKGGVAAITMVPDFLGHGGGLDVFCQHVEHAVGLIGSRHVAIGGDYDGCQMVPELAGVEHLPQVYHRLRQRGMNEMDVQQVMGGSVQALLEKVLLPKPRR